jgi:hypothetical protein
MRATAAFSSSATLAVALQSRFAHTRVVRVAATVATVEDGGNGNEATATATFAAVTTATVLGWSTVTGDVTRLGLSDTGGGGGGNFGNGGGTKRAAASEAALWGAAAASEAALWGAAAASEAALWGAAVDTDDSTEVAGSPWPGSSVAAASDDGGGGGGGGGGEWSDIFLFFFREPEVSVAPKVWRRSRARIGRWPREFSEKKFFALPHSRTTKSVAAADPHTHTHTHSRARRRHSVRGKKVSTGTCNVAKVFADLDSGETD